MQTERLRGKTSTSPMIGQPASFYSTALELVACEQGFVRVSDFRGSLARGIGRSTNGELARRLLNSLSKMYVNPLKLALKILVLSVFK